MSVQSSLNEFALEKKLFKIIAYLSEPQESDPLFQESKAAIKLVFTRFTHCIESRDKTNSLYRLIALHLAYRGSVQPLYWDQLKAKLLVSQFPEFPGKELSKEAVLSTMDSLVRVLAEPFESVRQFMADEGNDLHVGVLARWSGVLGMKQFSDRVGPYQQGDQTDNLVNLNHRPNQIILKYMSEWLGVNFHLIRVQPKKASQESFMLEFNKPQKAEDIFILSTKHSQCLLLRRQESDRRTRPQCQRNKTKEASKPPKDNEGRIKSNEVPQPSNPYIRNDERIQSLVCPQEKVSFYTHLTVTNLSRVQRNFNVPSYEDCAAQCDFGKASARADQLVRAIVSRLSELKGESQQGGAYRKALEEALQAFT